MSSRGRAEAAGDQGADGAGARDDGREAEVAAQDAVGAARARRVQLGQLAQIHIIVAADDLRLEAAAVGIVARQVAADGGVLGEELAAADGDGALRDADQPAEKRTGQ